MNREDKTLAILAVLLMGVAAILLVFFDGIPRG